jgi:hypothetical protein
MTEHSPVATAGVLSAMDFLYSLYDALVSINVPSDKARAVVDAMERDMGTSLATKTDLQLLRKDLELLESKIVIKLSVVMAGMLAAAGAVLALIR